MSTIALLALACSAAPPPPKKSIAKKKHAPMCATAALERTESRIQSEPGVEVFVVGIGAHGKSRGAIVFTHGAGSASSALWDLPGDYSLMRKLACKGWDTYSVDVRGYGGSTMPAAMKQPANDNPPVCRARDVQPDLAAAVQHAKKTSKVETVSLFAWSWGCVVAGMYASENPDQIDRLVLMSPVYDRRWPKRHITDRAWRTEKRQLFFDYHDPKREDREVLEAHVDALFRFTKGGELRLPNGAYRDIYGPDAPVWNPRTVRAKTLVIRGAKDRASLDEHAKRLVEHLEKTASKQYVVLDGAGHFVFRTHRYQALHGPVLSFFD